MGLVQYFLEEIDKEGIISKKTIEFYKSDLEFFEDFLEDISLDKVTQEELDRYLQYIKDRYSENTVIRKITSLKSFYKFLLKKEIIKESPIDKISTSRKNIKIRDKIEERELKAIIDICPDDFIGERDRIIIKLLASTGLKIVDILGIKLFQLKESDYKSFSLNQRNIFTIIDVYPELAQEIKEFVEKYKINSLFIFEGVDNQKFKTNFIKYAKLAKIDRNVVPSMIKNRYILEKKKVDTEEELDEIELFEKIKKEYLRIGIGDEGLK